MEPFLLENRATRKEGVFFPESITKERQKWGQTVGGTEGYWNKYRFLIGDVERVRRRIFEVASEYSAQRKRMPHLDDIRLYEGMNRIRPSALEYYDYAGRIDTISRESVVLVKEDGSQVSLPQDTGTGFRGIIVRTDEPFSLEAFAAQEMIRARIGFLNFGRDFSPGNLLGTHEPWKLRNAAEVQLSDLLNAAWMEYAQSPNDSRFNAVVEVERQLYNYVLDSMGWIQHMGIWEHARTIPFPNRTGALDLWDHDKIDDLDYDETEPWWISEPPAQTAKVTCFRRAFLSTGRLNITITTNPLLHTLEHPYLNVAHHLLTYGPVPTGPSFFSDAPGKDARFKPFMGVPGESVKVDPRTGKEVRVTVRTDPWNGMIDTPPQFPWNVLQAEGPLPEPTLDCRSRYIQMKANFAEQIEAAITGERPKLMWLPINGATSPVLVLPRMFFQVMIAPLYGGGRSLKVIEEGNKVEGWITDNTGDIPSGLPQPGTRRNFGPTPFGFLETPQTGRPLRDGAIQEILPYS